MRRESLHRHRISGFLAWVLAAVLCAAAANATERDTALGSAGELYIVRTGSFSSLFPNGAPGANVPGNNTVLALDVLKPGADANHPQRTLVPLTGGSEVEGSAAILFEDSTQTVFLVWESQIDAASSGFYIASYDPVAANWAQPIQVLGSNAVAVKTSPQLAITRDSYLDNSGAAPQVKRRTILHLVWEEQVGGIYKTFYKPLILQDGIYLTGSDIVALNDLEPPAAPTSGAGPAALSADWLIASSVQQGGDARTVVVGYASATSGQLVTFEINALPSEVVRLADATQNLIDTLGLQLHYPFADAADPNAALQSFVQQVHGGILAGAATFQPQVGQAIADQVASNVLAAGAAPASLVSISEKARAQIVDIGLRLHGHGLVPRFNGAAPPAPQKLEIQALDPTFLGSSSAPTTHDFWIRLASSRPLPTGVGAPLTTFLSDSGLDLVVAWPTAGSVQYTTSNSTGWDAPRGLQLSDGLDLAHAMLTLQQRIRN